MEYSTSNEDKHNSGLLRYFLESCTSIGIAGENFPFPSLLLMEL